MIKTKGLEELLTWVRYTLPMDLDWPKMIETKIELLIKKYNMPEKISDCCGAVATDPMMLDYGICPDCKDHCEFVNEDEEE